ncbi:MAG: YfcE family phosphodiesterase [Promethearchaeota archaeon]
MVNFLIIGDSHIPRRAKDIPEEIYEKITDLTKSEFFEYTFFTGDLIKCPKLIDFLNLKTNKDVLIVIGNMDYFDGNREAPLYQRIEFTFSNNETMTIGLTHGAQISPRGDLLQLEELAIEKQFNILISGHTHKEEIFLTEKGILLLNPGSVTGAWSFVASGIPSFIVLSIDENSKEIVVNLLQFDRKLGEISESRSYFIFENDRIQYKI